MIVRYIVLMTLVFASSSAQALDDHSVAMQKQKLSANDEKKLRDVVCSIKEFDCQQDGSSFTLYKAKQVDGVRYYVISISGLQLVLLRPISDGNFSIEHIWDASTYEHSAGRQSKEEQEQGALYESYYIYPGLYPIGPGRYLIAIVHTLSASYSCGGEAYQDADFLVLDNNKTKFDAASRVFTSVPFACENTAGTACHPPRNYTVGGATGHITIKLDPASAHDQYDWLVTWHEFDTPSGEGRPKTTVTTQTVRLVVGNKDNERNLNEFGINWCKR